MAKWPQRLCVVTAVPLLAFGCAEVIVGALVYNFTLNIKIGAWYVGVFAIITALVGFGAHFHTAFSGMYPIMCMLTATVALIGTLVDGIAYAVIGYIKACGNDGAHYWGDSDFYADALESCELPATSRDCYCVISHSSGCFSYDGNGKDTFDQDDCDPMIDEYPVILLELQYLSCEINRPFFFDVSPDACFKFVVYMLGPVFPELADILRRLLCLLR